jgi:5-methylcytosine-specific restriction endonuclease McrA
MNYQEQIKDPRWQKRRLEIFHRDNFTCQKCHSKKKELHVHHLIYQSGNMIWQYKDKELITLCSECHKYETDNLNEASKLLLYNIRTSGMLSDEIYALAEYHKGRKDRI